jgi:hypothetical protein
VLPGDLDLTDFELIDEGRHSAYREWWVPAELVSPGGDEPHLTVSDLPTTVDQEKGGP